MMRMPAGAMPWMIAVLLLAACGGGSDAGGASPPPGGGTPPVIGPSLVFLVQPTPAQVNTALAPAVQVELRDASGVRIIGGPGSGSQADTGVSLSVSSGPAGSSLQGTTVRTSVGGVATFTDLRLTVPGDYVLRALSTGRPHVDSIQFTITAPGVPPPPPPPPAGPTQLAFIVQPLDTNLGVNFALSPRVEIRDASGVGVPTATGLVTVSLEGGPPGASLVGSATAAATAGTGGVATFNGLSIDTVGTGYRLRATSPGLADAVSAPFDVLPTAGPPTQLRFMDPIPDAPVRGYLAPVRVEVLDASGVRVTNAQVDVTVELETNPGQLLLRGGTVVNHQDGWLGGWPSQVLEIWDPAAGQSARSALLELPFESQACHALAVDFASGFAYALQQAGTSAHPWVLTHVDLTGNGSPSVVSILLPAIGIGGIAVDSDGKVLVAGVNPATGGLFKVDPQTGQDQALGPLTLTAGTISQVLGLSVQPATGDIYGLCSLEGQSGGLPNIWLVRFDRVSLTGNVIGRLPFATYCITFAPDGSLYASAVPVPPPAADIFESATNPYQRGWGGWPEVHEVDLQNATATLVTTSPLEGKTVFAGMPAFLRGLRTRAAVGGMVSIDGLSLDSARPGYRLRAVSTGISAATSSFFEVTAPAAQLPSLRFSVNSQTVNEGTATATVEVQQSGPSLHEVTAYIVLSGEAFGDGVHHNLKAPLDSRDWYWLLGLNSVEGLMSVTIPPGQTSHTISLTITDDNLTEPDRWLFMRLIRPFGAVLGNTTTHSLQIIDND